MTWLDLFCATQQMFKRTHSSVQYNKSERIMCCIQVFCSHVIGLCEKKTQILFYCKANSFPSQLSNLISTHICWNMARQDVCANIKKINSHRTFIYESSCVRFDFKNFHCNLLLLSTLLSTSPSWSQCAASSPLYTSVISQLGPLTCLEFINLLLVSFLSLCAILALSLSLSLSQVLLN